ncbi:MAG: hypothetical protein IH940_05955, partial [Acidobacteria bacterium]|nr:hypothetical protein [Acidobacteriota bacterium]
MRFRALILATTIALALVASACADDDANGGDDTTTSSEEPAETTSITAPLEEETETTASPVTSSDEAGPPSGEDIEWVTHEAGAGCVCTDGSEYIYFSRTNNPEKVLLYYQGGGACFSEEMCDFNSGSYDATIDPDEHPSDPGSGIFELDNPNNPFADWSIIFMPYCSGDVFLGDTTNDYDDDGDGEVLTIEHRGYRNALHG